VPEFLPFKGIRYNPSKVGDVSRVVAPPYDILSDQDVLELYRRSPYNVIRIDLGKYQEATALASRTIGTRGPAGSFALGEQRAS